MRRTKPWIGAVLALLLAGCGGPPASPPGPNPAQQTAIMPASVPEALVAPVVPPPPPPRYLAFTACREDRAGALFLWDAALMDVFILNAALAGVVPDGKQVGGPVDCDQLAQLNPRAFGKGKVLFSFGTKVFVYDPITEERITAATDGRPLVDGGPIAAITPDGKLLAYVSFRGTLVLKPTDPVYATKTRELTDIAAELDALAGPGVIWDVDLSADGTLLVLNVDGTVYLYDVATPGLIQVVPLSGTALAGAGYGFGRVAISPNGQLIACAIADHRLLVIDLATGLVDVVPYVNLGVNGPVGILDVVFGEDGRSLYIGTLVAGSYKVWRYDVLNETLRALAILNNVLGEAWDDVEPCQL